MVIGGQVILTLKNVGTAEENAKVRFVEKGYNDEDKLYIVHDTAIMRSSSIRLI